ncbi:Ribonuclease E inhibitor RraA/Dimethylmenaquinone methyltransferase [Moorella glycerini]|uniref:Putative 4-hydroxy-4-methyl-2-oxoglutarate aldolase n=1 Tax=Neomoorella stamsii TaxID=1266720 RepID=A0A9X7J1V7_9FIRM|nr:MULTISPECIES: RraA family protein [Moorella]PRR70053.1 4-hydroxy-4-methyl-2-oxoglutarate aldolase [Moorella stamsii]CEP66125.1 Ribonuclease E inhibitor RraA/Dimethylmenaquinone methyltransferase [Moorella glycerini]
MAEKLVRIDPAVINAFKQLDTTSVSDALDRLGIVGGLEGIKPVVSGVTLCGPAFTVHYVPCGVVKGTVGDFLDDVEPGQVVVIDNAGRTYCTVWGDLMSLTASIRGVAGTVIDGVCRDITGIRKLQYPIFTRGYFMVTGKDRVQVDAVNVPVAISGVQVKPGDIMLGDDTGVLVIPQERAEEVLAVAQEIAEKEALIEREIRAGATLREARKKVGYHNLQTRRQ